MLLGSSFARLDEHLLGGGECFLCLLLLHASRGFASFLYQYRGLRIGLQDDFVALGLGLSQFGFDLLRVSESLCDLHLPLCQHFQNWLISEAMQNNADDGETDDLSQQMRPVNAKRICDLLNLPWTLR